MASPGALPQNNYFACVCVCVHAYKPLHSEGFVMFELLVLLCLYVIVYKCACVHALIIHSSCI